MIDIISRCYIWRLYDLKNEIFSGSHSHYNSCRTRGEGGSISPEHSFCMPVTRSKLKAIVYRYIYA